MATPQLITISGTLNPFTGAKKVKFRNRRPFNYSIGPDVVLPQTREATVSQVNGTFTIQVPSSNDPAWSPANQTYEITIEGDNLNYQFDAQIPYGSSPLDFSDILPALTPSQGLAYAPLSHNHTIAQVTDLQTQLDGKQAAGVYLTAADIANLVSTTALIEALALYTTTQLLDLRGNLLTSGEEVLPRDDVAGEVALVSGVAYFSFFTARKTETITQLRTATGATAAVGTTLARVGVFSTNGTTLTQVANTANDNALWGTANTMFPKTLAASWNKVAGQRYALCYVWAGSTPPIVEGVQIRPNSVSLQPRIQGELSGQANLPAGPTEASLTGGFRRFQCIFLP